MSNAAAMLATYPKAIDADRSILARVIDEVLTCFQTCTACADACLSEDDVQELATCVRLNADCASVCLATVQVLSRHTGYDATISAAQLHACITACAACAAECDRHARSHEHCRICAQTCRACEQACRDLLAAFG